MNESGRAVKKTYEEKLHNTQTFHPRNRRTIILHDSIDQKPCTVSPRFGGSARGHNGVRSIISALGTSEFYRMRLGIGYPPNGMPLEQYVLGKLSQEEVEYWSPGGEGVEKVWEAIIKIVQDECVLSCSPVPRSHHLILRPHTHGEWGQNRARA
jgi:peptidyl-tRNA hydrolase, PTH1 family